MKDFNLRLWDDQEGRMAYSETWGNMPWETIQAAQATGRLMVSSGLTDASGRLLYEGDYVRVYNTYKELPYKAQVIFKNAQFLLETDALTTHNRWINYELHYIGNCFETPGLLQMDEVSKDF